MMSGMNMGMKNGLTLPGPLSFRILQFFSRVMIPPTPLPRITPKSVGEHPCGGPESPAEAMASSAAATPSCAKRSKRRASFGARWFRGSKPSISHAIRVA